MKEKINMKVWVAMCRDWECFCIAIFDHKPSEKELKEVGFCRPSCVDVEEVELKDILNKRFGA